MKSSLTIQVLLKRLVAFIPTLTAISDVGGERCTPVHILLARLQLHAIQRVSTALVADHNGWVARVRVNCNTCCMLFTRLRRSSPLPEARLRLDVFERVGCRGVCGSLQPNCLVLPEVARLVLAHEEALIG